MRQVGKNPTWAREVVMRNAAERHARDQKSRERSIRIVQAALRAGLVTVEEITEGGR